jgi:hypothetical protein
MKMQNARFGVLVLLAGLISPLAWAQNNPLITVDENGKGSLLFPAGNPFVLTGVLAPDPGPGGLPLSLTYNLLGPPGLVAGDLVMLEPGNAIVSDIIRFNSAGTGGLPGYPASLVFYSDNLDPADALADTGMPTALYANSLAVTEVGPEGNNGFTYTPTSTQPGFIPGFSVTYQIVSDTPEPGAMSLIILVGGLLARWRK